MSLSRIAVLSVRRQSAVTFHNLAAAHRLSGAAAELQVDETTSQMLPEGNHLPDVGSPGRVEAETTEVWLTETTPQEVVTQPDDRLIHLLESNESTQPWINNECLSIL